MSSVNVIIRLMLSLLIWPKVITLSGFYCSIIVFVSVFAFDVVVVDVGTVVVVILDYLYKGSISPTFYEQLLRVQIPKGEKRQSS